MIKSHPSSTSTGLNCIPGFIFQFTWLDQSEFLYLPQILLEVALATVNLSYWKNFVDDFLSRCFKIIIFVGIRKGSSLF